MKDENKQTDKPDHLAQLQDLENKLLALSEELTDARHSLAFVADRLPVGLVLVEETGAILEANNCALDLMGSRQVVSLSFVEFVHQDDQEIYLEYQKSFVQGDVAKALQLSLSRQSGETLRVELFAAKTEAPTPRYLICLQDKSEQSALERQLMSRFTPNRKLLHELSNLFATNLGYTELTEMLLSDTDEVSGVDLQNLKRYTKEVHEGLLKMDDQLQRSKRPHALVESRPASVPGTREDLLVMIVDDEEAITKYLIELLSQHGLSALGFSDSQEASDYYRTHFDKVDLAIIDQSMPKLSGLDLVTDMLSVNKDLPIILCTGNVPRVEAQKIGGINIRYFLSKPIDINDLLGMVDQITSEQKTRSTGSE